MMTHDVTPADLPLESARDNPTFVTLSLTLVDIRACPMLEPR